MLEVSNVSKKYGDTVVLDKMSFVARKGEVVSLLGANGSGKTTTFKIILGLLEEDEGEVLFNKRKIDVRKTGYLPEERSMFYDVTVYEQLKFFGRLKGMNDRELESRIDHLLDVTKTSKYRNMLPIQLSKGNQQKIQLIISILHDPDILIMDEPWTGLDQSNIAIFQRVISEQKKANKVIILSSHQHQQVQEICDRYLYLKEGKIRINVSKKQLENDKKRMLTIRCDRDVSFSKEEVIYKTREKDMTKCIIADESRAIDLINKVKSYDNVMSYSVSPLTISDLIGIKK